MAKGSYKDNALFRFFNIIFVLGYIFVFLATLVSIYLAHTERKILTESVQCKNGNKFDITTKNYDIYEKCGLCTNWDKTTEKFSACSLKDYDYTSYDTKYTYEAWTWSYIIYPVIALVVGLLVVDFLRLSTIYIFSGTFPFIESVLLKIIIFFATLDNKE